MQLLSFISPHPTWLWAPLSELSGYALHKGEWLCKSPWRQAGYLTKLFSSCLFDQTFPPPFFLVLLQPQINHGGLNDASIFTLVTPFLCLRFCPRIVCWTLADNNWLSRSEMCITRNKLSRWSHSWYLSTATGCHFVKCFIRNELAR